jgi:hypothetical protein
MFNFSGVQLLSPLLHDPEEFPQILVRHLLFAGDIVNPNPSMSS